MVNLIGQKELKYRSICKRTAECTKLIACINGCDANAGFNWFEPIYQRPLSPNNSTSILSPRQLALISVSFAPKHTFLFVCYCYLYQLQYRHQGQAHQVLASGYASINSAANATHGKSETAAQSPSRLSHCSCMYGLRFQRNLASAASSHR